MPDDDAAAAARSKTRQENAGDHVPQDGRVIYHGAGQSDGDNSRDSVLCGSQDPALRSAHPVHVALHPEPRQLLSQEPWLNSFIMAPSRPNLPLLILLLFRLRLGPLKPAP